MRECNRIYKTLTKGRAMTNEDQQIEDVKQDSLTPYLEAESRRNNKGKKTRKNKDLSKEASDSQPEAEGSPLSDEEVLLAMSEPPSLPERLNIKKNANVLKRTFPEFTKLKTQGDWERAYELAEDSFLSGQFLINNLGADRYVEPNIAVTLIVLRQKLIQDMQLDSAAEYMMMDVALTANYNFIKAQRMFGDLAVLIEKELFQEDSLSLNLKADGSLDLNTFKVDAMLDRASDSLMVLIDKSSKLMIVSLKALRDYKSGALSIRAEQINIGNQQVNQMVEAKNKKRTSRTELRELPEEPSTDS